MSKIQVNSIVNRSDDGAVTFSKGAIVPSGQIFSIQGNASLTGVVTASSFVGDGSNLNNLAIATTARSVAYKAILAFDEYRA